MSELQKSEGHICFAFDGKVEFYESTGEVYRAQTHHAFQTNGRRYARWECSRAHFDRYRDVITGLEP